MRSVRSGCLTNEAGLTFRMPPVVRVEQFRMAAKCFFDVGFEALKDRDFATSQPKYMATI